MTAPETRTQERAAPRISIVSESLPPALQSIMVPMPQAEDYDGPEYLTFNRDFLIYAFVNCFKEIDARLRALETARGT